MNIDRALRAVALLVCCAPLVGCSRKAAVSVANQTALTPTRIDVSPFETAIEFVNQLDQYQPDQAREQILYNLRQWIRDQDSDEDWIADPMVRRLPSEFEQAVAMERLSMNEFEQYDAFELQEAVWLKDVSQAVAQKPLVEPEVKAWLDGAVDQGRLNRNQAQDLSLAHRLFDWTVRNIQLDPEFQDYDILGGEKERTLRDADTPRHIYNPWETLLYSHGDWLERSRIFILLARQAGIPVVMLVADRGEDQPAQAWVTAALIGEQLYLFDALLGLPLPGPDGAVMSSLDDYLQDPALLDALNVADQRYRIVASDLENLLAAVDAAPAALSQRMRLVESRLSGSKKMVLTAAPTPLGIQLRKCRGVNGVEIWTFPYRGYDFRNSIRDPAKAQFVSRELVEHLRREKLPFDQLGAMLKGRILQFKGYYRGDDERRGATHYLMESRLPKIALQAFDRPFDQLPPPNEIENPNLRQLVASLPQDPIRARIVYDQYMMNAKEVAQWSKALASYWLGTIAFEKREFRVASDFLTRIVDSQEQTSWRQSAHYNLSRSYEAMARQAESPGKADELLTKAITLLQSDTVTPQNAGNILRVKRLERN